MRILSSGEAEFEAALAGMLSVIMFESVMRRGSENDGHAFILVTACYSDVVADDNNTDGKDYSTDAVTRTLLQPERD